MKARKIDLSAWPLSFLPGAEAKAAMYDIRGSLAELCFVAELELTGTALLEAERVARAVLDEPSQELLLAEADWGLLARAASAHKGFARADVELVRRVLRAPQVDVQER